MGRVVETGGSPYAAGLRDEPGSIHDLDESGCISQGGVVSIHGWKLDELFFGHRGSVWGMALFCGSRVRVRFICEAQRMLGGEDLAQPGQGRLQTGAMG